jgi:hypothetical protein
MCLSRKREAESVKSEVKKLRKFLTISPLLWFIGSLAISFIGTTTAQGIFIVNLV